MSFFRNTNRNVFCFVLRLTVKAVAVLLPILGISWIFGVLAVNRNSLVFLYIFAVFNSLQVSSSLEGLFFCKMFVKKIYKTWHCLFFLGVLCLLISLSSQLWGMMQLNCLSVLFCHILYEHLETYSRSEWISLLGGNYMYSTWHLSLVSVVALPHYRWELLSNTKPRCGPLPAAPSETSMWSHSTLTLWVLLLKIS